MPAKRAGVMPGVMPGVMRVTDVENVVMSKCA